MLGTAERCQCVGAPTTEADRQAAQRIGERWLEFARIGTPQAAGQIAWPPDSARRAVAMEFGETTTVQPDFMQARLNAFIAALNVAQKFLGGR